MTADWQQVLDVPPHCDQKVLHAPGECKYCDARPEWQALRQMWGIAFTGHQPVWGGYGAYDTEMSCPSDFVRGLGQAGKHWPGNRPEGYGDVEPT